MAKGKEPDRRLESQWRRIVGEHKQSWLNIRQFCRRGKLRETAFHFWRRVHVCVPMDRQALADELAVLEGHPC